MNTVKHLLPHNASSLEKCAAECLRWAVENAIPIPALINPDKCPEHILPYLAWAFSVDRWEENWTEEIKRMAIKHAFWVHKQKGTVSAIRRIVESLGYEFEIREWFKEKNQRPAGTFRIFVELKETGTTPEIYQELARLIEEAKPVSRHITELAISATSRGKMNVFSTSHCGEIITIYPK